MIIAVLEAHCGVRLGQHDVYLNVAGGYRITEPAADLANLMVIAKDTAFYGLVELVKIGDVAGARAIFDETADVFSTDGMFSMLEGLHRQSTGE